jgi:8-oxo-dGTP pyrophosphatase MutT (NUDIX family)
MLNFLATGNWSDSQVVAHLIDHSFRMIDPEVESLIDRTWTDAAQNPAIHLFDGPTYRLESWRASRDRLELTLAPTTYRTFYGTNLHNPHLADTHGPDILANPVGVSPALLSADHFLLLGRRNAQVAYYPNRVHPFAGALDPCDTPDGTGSPNVFHAVRRELREELHFTDDDLADLRCLGLVEDQQIRQPELIFLARSTLTRAAIEARVDTAEHGGSVAIAAERAAVERAIRDDALTPVAVASMLLWGRIELGEEWARSHLPAGSVAWYR